MVAYPCPWYKQIKISDDLCFLSPCFFNEKKLDIVGDRECSLLVAE